MNPARDSFLTDLSDKCDGARNYAPDDFDSATARTNAIRKNALDKPEVKQAVEEKLAGHRKRAATLAAIRKARGLTQIQLSQELGLTQSEISRLERRDNLHLSTLARFIEATGGHLKLIAKYGEDEIEVHIADLTHQDESTADETGGLTKPPSR